MRSGIDAPGDGRGARWGRGVAAALAFLAATGAAAQPDGTGATGPGGWELRRSPGSAAGAPPCTLALRENPRVAVAKDRLKVEAASKNGILNYQYRIDDGPPSPPAIPTDAMRAAGAIFFTDAALARIMDGHRLQVRVLDGLHEALTEDIDLTGLKALYRSLYDACG